MSGTRDSSTGTVPATVTFTRGGNTETIPGTVNDSGAFFANASGLSANVLNLVLAGVPQGSASGTITKNGTTQKYAINGQYNYSLSLALLPPLVQVNLFNRQGTFTATQ